MAVSSQQAQKFSDWLTSRGVSTLSCDICQHNSYGIDIIAPISQQANKDKVSNGSYDLQNTVPIVLCSCDNCGSIKFFDAKKIGLLKAEE